MAAVCPQCERIHFETNRAALPTHCAGCGHDLSLPVVPAETPTPTASAAPPRPADGSPYLYAGLATLCVAGWCLLTGVAERGRYLPVTATVTASYLEWANVKGQADLLTGAIPGLAQAGNSVYVVDGRTYRTTIDRRWRLGDHFEVWYLPDSPADATEVRPYGRLIAAVGMLVMGLFLIGRGFGIFGAAVESPIERLKVPMAAGDEGAPRLAEEGQPGSP